MDIGGWGGVDIEGGGGGYRGVGRLSCQGQVVHGTDKAPFRNYENKRLGQK